MRFWRSPFGAAALVLLLGLGVVLGATVVQVERETTPPRRQDSMIDFSAVMMRVDEVEFPAGDGVRLAGWLIHGRRDLPPVILCHDAGSSKGALINLAIAVRQSGFGVLLFDFRGHGESGGTRSTLGLHEKRDVSAAVDFLSRHPDYAARRVGIYGVGMGAHAAVLAAADRPTVKVLVLDALYPDVSFRLVRDVYGGWGFAEDHLGFLPRGVFTLIAGAAPRGQRAADVVGRLLGRDLLFLVPAGDSELAREIERMYAAVPQQADADGNLVVLPATQSDGLYRDQLARYHERVQDFLATRLGAATALETDAS